MKLADTRLLAAFFGTLSCLVSLWADPVTITNAVVGEGIVLGTGTYESGTEVTLRAVPQVDWKFERWEGVLSEQERENPTNFRIDSGKQPKAIFKNSKGEGRFSGGIVKVFGGNLFGAKNIPTNLQGVIGLACGPGHILALKSDGTVVSWGAHWNGKTNVPVGLRGVVAVAAGTEHSLALKSDGKVIAWGQSQVPENLENVISISAGGGHSLALKSDGSIIAWGANNFGQTNVPANLRDILMVSAGGWHNLALRRDGTVVSWGDNSVGLGNVPAGLSNAISVSAGYRHSLALWEDGTVVGWGEDRYGKASPPNDLTGAVSIFASIRHSLAIDRSGRIWAWGENTSGQIVRPSDALGFTAVVGGEDFTAGIQATNREVALVTDWARSVTLEIGSTLRLKPMVVSADKFFWTRNGQPIETEFGRWLEIPSVTQGDSGQYQLVAVSEFSGILTPPTVVKVVPRGTPKLTVNSREVVNLSRFGDSVDLALSTSFPEGQVFFTLDGSAPGVDSQPFAGTLTITSNVVVRAYAVSGDFSQEATSDPINIQIVPTCGLANSVNGGGQIELIPALNRYLQDDIVNVRAVPNEGWRFVRWDGDLSGSFPDRNVVMNRDKAVKAVFEEIPRFELSAIANGGAVTGAGAYYQGTSVDLSAVPALGWVFLDWGGDFVGTDTNFSWTVAGPAHFEARFGTPVSTLASGSGTIRLEPDQPLYAYGSQVKVIPVPNAGQYLALWGEAGAGQPRTEWVLTVTNGSPRVTALFRPLADDKVTLTIQSTLGGRITQPAVDGLYAKGSSVTITAVPDTGYEFTGWTGDATGTEPSVTLTLDASKTARAEFRRIGVQTHPLVVTVDGPGTVRRIPDLGAYETGSEVELVADPAVDAAFTGWTGAASSTQKRIRVTISGPTSLQAAFLPIHPVVTEVRGEGQILLSPPDGRYLAGTALALTAKPAEGWGFVQWSGDLSTTGQEASLKVDAPKRVIAEFARLGTLTTKVIGSGTIMRTPEGQSFLPGTQVTLRAEPTAGWKFVKWIGGAVGTNAEVQVTVGRTEAIVAEFTDGESPALVLSEPQSGTVTVEKFRLKGTVTDNVAVASVGWSWNGAPQSALKLTDGRFETGELTLKVGANQFEVVARDAAGNESRVAREVIWTPIRSLNVGTAVEVQEGQRLAFPVTLSAPGDVGGLTFQLRYDPTLLTDAQFEWGSLVGQSINNLNLSTSGEIGASFSLAGLALPSGTNPVATVSFRARSVPAVTNASLVPVIVSVATPAGDALATGNAAVAGGGRILPRKIRGDNNANQRIDVGDAVVISRLQLGLEEVRPWDVLLNDLNDTGTLDNGDVIKALRIVVGLDLQPKSAPRVGPSGLDSQPIRPAGSNTNDVATLEFPDGPVAQVGKPYRVVVKLLRAGAPISGVSLMLNHPSAFKVISKEFGPLVPSDALPLWGEASAGMNLAAIRSTLWPSSTGVMAVLTLLPTEEITTRPQWAVELVKGEVTGAGFDIRALDDVRGEIRSESQPPVALKVVLPTPDSNGGPLALDIEAATGAAIVLETTTDLSAWTEDRRLTGQGTGKPVRVTVTPDPNTRVRFWRVRVP